MIQAVPRPLSASRPLLAAPAIPTLGRLPEPLEDRLAQEEAADNVEGLPYQVACVSKRCARRHAHRLLTHAAMKYRCVRRPRAFGKLPLRRYTLLRPIDPASHLKFPLILLPSLFLPRISSSDSRQKHLVRRSFAERTTTVRGSSGHDTRRKVLLTSMAGPMPPRLPIREAVFQGCQGTAPDAGVAGGGEAHCSAISLRFKVALRSHQRIELHTCRMPHNKKIWERGRSR